ncbi:MAG: ion transporter [Planctomycetota bacterium]|jgi:voltage-gated potassium channel
MPTSQRERVHEIIFEADTPAGKAFDVALILLIVLSVMAVVLDSVESIRADFGTQLDLFEWVFTILFTIEYGLRLMSVNRPIRYAISFFGVVDLLAILPTYLSLIIPSTESLLVIRALRLLRIFRVFKLANYVGEAQILLRAMRASLRKIMVFMGAVLTVQLIMATFMYLVEGPENGFSSIPESMYWTIVTMTTVGYGDITPGTLVGKCLASVMMIIGYAIIAVPTGIVTVEMSRGARRLMVTTQSCPDCGAEGHGTDATFCKACGAKL